MINAYSAYSTHSTHCKYSAYQGRWKLITSGKASPLSRHKMAVSQCRSIFCDQLKCFQVGFIVNQVHTLLWYIAQAL